VGGCGSTFATTTVAKAAAKQAAPAAKRRIPDATKALLDYLLSP
jgi:hypothetical protein